MNGRSPIFQHDCVSFSEIFTIPDGIHGRDQLWVSFRTALKNILRRLLGVRTEGDKKGAKVQKLAKNEVNTHQHCSFLASLSCQVLMVNIGSLSTGGRVIAVKADLAKIALTTPVCTEVLEKIALSRMIDKHWRLIGWGQIRRGIPVKPTERA